MERGYRGGWMLALLLLLLPSVHRSQSTLNNVQRQSTQSEALLRRGSSYISLTSSLRLEPGSLLGFSFRTCAGGGQLVSRGGDTDSVKLLLTAAGQLRLELRAANLSREIETVGAGSLADGAWHTVRVGVAVGGARLCLSVDSDVECDPPRPGPSVLNTPETGSVRRLDDLGPLLGSGGLNLTGELVVGRRLVGCVREGPGLRFTTGEIESQAGVSWGACLLPDTCQGYDWASLGDLNSPADLCSGPNQCDNGGLCYPVVTAVTVVTVTTCVCPPRYTGPRCGSLVTRCDEAPCRHGGNCTEDTAALGAEDTGGFRCDCAGTGHSGTHCHIEDNSCAGQTCNNGATCLDQPRSFLCDCAAGFTGRRCDSRLEPVDVTSTTATSTTTTPATPAPAPPSPSPEPRSSVPACAAAPCLHGGICTDTAAGGFTCSCPGGYTGDTCQEDVDECATSSPCVRGNCSNTDGGFLCACPPGFSGLSCEVNTDECEARPCQNGGTCVDGLNTYTCQCDPRFMGDNCERSYDACGDQPCLNGATCTSLADQRTGGQDFDCTCELGFRGARCEENIDDCVGVECSNPHHACRDGLNNYTCSCPPGSGGDTCAPCAAGWEGDNCEADIDECARDETICNSGICRNTAGGYECYCKPGFTGLRCDVEYDECLSTPCLNNGTCVNLVNAYNCSCQPGFDGENCEINIDECAVDPCRNGATCIDGVNSYTCNCSPGYEGTDCETDIDDCASTPCLNGGACVDGVNLYTCNCANTGFTGDTCDTDIDECEVAPCLHNSTCHNEVNDYTCDCHAGYTDKNCGVDIRECEAEPCQNNATCYELSDTALYNVSLAAALPPGIRGQFLEEFSYERAAGYLCDCPRGFKGVNCEINIDECEGGPCQHGATCVDGIAQYSCRCLPGYEGRDCEVEIDECARHQPCQNGAQCRDMIADYKCYCEENFGGKNCSVPLTGCQEVECLNGGSCTPGLRGETDHYANCSCTEGYDGDRCQVQTTFSFKGDSFITVQTDRDEGYELSFSFRTTLSNGVVAIGQGPTFFTLQLLDGKLKVHSNMLQEIEGVTLSSGNGNHLNNTEWQKVYLAFNSTSLIMGLNNRYTANHPINPDSPTQTAFNMTYLGGSPRNTQARGLVKPVYEEFIGCIQDIRVNGIKVTEEVLGTQGVVHNNTEIGCAREDQCNPNPCQNEGTCVDLWRTKKCLCVRPYLGPNCEYNYTSATFGHENITNSIAVVNIDNPRAYKYKVDLTMFIRTRQSTGLVFYLGKSELNSTLKNFIIGRLENGALHVDISMNDQESTFNRNPLKLYSAQLSDGNRHFIRVKWLDNKIRIAVNHTIYINQELPITVPIQAERLYLGNLNIMEPVTTPPPTTTTTLTSTTTTSTTTTSTTTTSTTTSASTSLSSTSGTIPPVSAPVIATTEPIPVTELPTEMPDTILAEETVPEDITTAISEPIISRQARDIDDDTRSNDFLKESYFKGVIEDVRLGDGETEKIVNFYELQIDAEESSLGFVDVKYIKEGVVSDNACRENPCQNGGWCRVTWNDYFCKCEEGYKGENCEEIEFCHWRTCPENSTCNTLKDGHECVSNVTLNGEDTFLSYSPSLSQEVDIRSMSLKFRTQATGTVMQLVKPDGQDINFSVNNGRFEIVVKASGGNVIENFTFGHDLNDGAWHTAEIKPIEGSLLGILDNADDEELLEDNSVFNNLDNYVRSSEIILGSSRQSNQGITFSSYFRGCVGEVRVAGILLPYFTEAELANTTTPDRFVLQPGPAPPAVTRGECVLCYQEECLNAGVCADPAEQFECSCPVGFSGATCGVNIDECEANQCVHGGCVDGVGNYTCSCDLGWTGWLCDLDKDECEDAPCRNGGSCTQTPQPGDYQCACLPEYKGKNCSELKIKTCAQEPCLNAGTCISEAHPGSSDQYRCDCAQGYTGYNCENQIDYCVKLAVSCQNGGQCQSDFSSFSYNCFCKPGYIGKHCEEDVDDCASAPCQNSGVCTDGVDSYSCDCAHTGFRGARCEQNIDECLVSPCLHGRCNDTWGDYVCMCEDTYCGKNCSRRNPCLNSVGLCKNEGSCIADCDTADGYTCSCPAGWEGRNCHLKSSQTEELALIVGPIVGGMAFIALVGLAVFLVMARRKRKGEGHYRPAKQELTSPRLQLDNMLKIPPEERLI